jgi:hypothetical protein
VSPAAPLEVGHPHGHVVPSDGGTGFGSRVESFTADTVVVFVESDVVCAPAIAGTTKNPAATASILSFILSSFE